MSAKTKLKTLLEVLGAFLKNPRLSARLLFRLPTALRAFDPLRVLPASDGPRHVRSESEGRLSTDSANPLRAYFDAHTEGRGIWKWNHYFDIYQRHLSKYVGREVHVLEVGVYSGGSLEMWKEYFGPGSRIYGVDTEEACTTYQDSRTRIFVGDQADREFWRRMKQQIPPLDILIDDGGHLAQQQIVTLEEMLPHIRTGGVYLCEDILGPFNPFMAYIYGLACNLNALETVPGLPGCQPTQFQNMVQSIHCYPYMTVIEKPEGPVQEFIAPKRGTQWQPFFD